MTDKQMKMTLICNNKAAILHFARKDKIYLFSYGRLIMSQDLKNGDYVRHIQDPQLVTHTTMKHINEFACPQKFNLNTFFKLKYKRQ